MITKFTANQIQARVMELAAAIQLDYSDKELVLLGVLNGSFIFMSDLCRSIEIPHRMDFLGTSSYGNNSSSSGNVVITKELQIDIFNKDVLLVEDILDTGNTIHFLKSHLLKQSPATFSICTLFWKSKNQDIEPQYYGFQVQDNEFLVGYGLDFAGKYRHLPYVASLAVT